MAGANRRVLERVKQSGDIFFARSDDPWVLSGANVHISFVGQDDGSETDRELDGALVRVINADLTSGPRRDQGNPSARECRAVISWITEGRPI